MSILSVSRLSSSFAWFFISDILEFKSLILLTSSNLKIMSNLFLRLNDVSDLFKLSKLNLKISSKNKPTAWPWLILNSEVKGYDIACGAVVLDILIA